MSSYFVSDLHLQDDADQKSQIFVKVLQKYGPHCQRLVLLGDIFDSWIADHDYFRKKYSTVVTELVRLRSLGVEIHFFEGNHDLHLKEFWQDRHGIPVHTDIAHFHWHGKRIRCEHGDLMNPRDTNYLLLRRFLRTKMIRKLSFKLPGTKIGGFAEKWSQHSRKKTSRQTPDRDQRIREMMHTYAVKEARAEPFDYLITGHTHIRDEFVIPRGASFGGLAPSPVLGKQTQIFLNLGTWLDRPTILKLSDTGHEFIDLSSFSI